MRKHKWLFVNGFNSRAPFLPSPAIGFVISILWPGMEMKKKKTFTFWAKSFIWYSFKFLFVIMSLQMAPLCLSASLWMPQPFCYHCTYCLKGDLLPPSWGIFSGSPGYDSFSTPCPPKWPTVCSPGCWGLDSPRAITGYSFKVNVRCHFDHWQSLMFRLSVTKLNIFQVKMFSSWDMIFCFASGYQQVCSHTVFIVVSVLALPSILTELFLQPSRVNYNTWSPNEHSQNFQWF